MKTCNKCGETKEFSEFWKNKKTTDGYTSICTTCIKERNKKLKGSPLLQLEKAVKSSIIVENKILSREGKKLCCSCKNIFLITEISSGYCKKCQKEIGKEYHEKNRDIRIIQSRERYLKNKEYYEEKNKEYYEKNIEKMTEYRKQYHEQYQKENKEKINEYQRQRRKENKEKINEKQRQYRKENKKRLNEKQRQYQRENKEKINEYQRQRYLKLKEGN